MTKRNIKIIIITILFSLQSAYSEDIKTLSNLQSKKVIQVSQEEMKEFISNNPNNKVIKKKIKDGDEKEKKEEVKKVIKEETHVYIAPPNSNFTIASGGHLNSDSALIVFAVVGLMVVIMWLPYFPILAYKSLKGDMNTSIINHFSFQTTPIHSKLRNGSRSGVLLSARHSFYIQKEKTDDFTLLGLSSELGHYDFDQYNNRLKGEYFLIGPSIILNSKLDLKSDHYQTFGKIDLMAGTSFDGNLGLVSKAEVSIMGKFYRNFTAGFGLGALYFDVNESRGLATNVNDLGLFYSGKIGYMF
jgi:hypothetical protein